MRADRSEPPAGSRDSAVARQRARSGQPSSHVPDGDRSNGGSHAPDGDRSNGGSHVPDGDRPDRGGLVPDGGRPDPARVGHESTPTEEAWVYESLLGAMPGIQVDPRTARAIQFGGFELAVVFCWLVYDLPTIGLVAGSVVVAVATVGSLAMVTIADAVRTGREPARYRRFVLGSRIELVLGLVAFIGLVTYLFVVDPRESPVLLNTLLGPEPPALAVFLLLLLGWDVCYRIGTAWWASVTGLWRTVALPADQRGSSHRRRLDLATLAFGVLQLSLLPFVLDHPLLVAAVSGHVAAVVLVSGTTRVLEARASEN